MSSFTYNSERARAAQLLLVGCVVASAGLAAMPRPFWPSQAGVVIAEPALPRLTLPESAGEGRVAVYRAPAEVTVGMIEPERLRRCLRPTPSQ